MARASERQVTALSTGERIRLYRTRRGLSRERRSGLAGVSQSWLKQVENGTRKADSLRLLVAVAEALNMPVWDLIPGPRRLAPDGGPQDEAITRLESALLSGVFTPQNATVPGLASMRVELNEAWVARSSGRFAEAADRLAALVKTAEAAVQHHADATRALELYAEVHWLTAYTLFRAGERGEHARIAADRFVTAARHVGDPMLMAASARCLGHVLLHVGEAEAAQAVIRDALDALASGLTTADDDYLSVYGALLLASALAEARLGDSASCRRLLAEAEELARRVGDVDRYHMSFGPTNLLVHAVSCALELGDFREVIRVGRQVDTSQLPPELMVRRAQVQLDMATAHEHQRHDEAAVLRLLEADRTAPQFIRNSAVAREIVRAILRRPGGKSIPGLLDLARRVGALMEKNAPEAAGSSHLVTRAGRRPYLTVLPGWTEADVREPVPVIDRDDGDGAGASGAYHRGADVHEVLTSGIDSLYFSVRAPVRPEAWGLLKRAKDRAECGAPARAPGAR